MQIAFVAPAALVISSLGLIFLRHSGEPPPSATEAIEANQGMVGIRAVRLASDTVGSHLLGGPDGNTRVRVLDLIWGLRENGELGIAFFKGIELLPSGENYYEFSHVDRFAELVFDLEAVEGFFLRDDASNELVWADSASMIVRRDGLLGFQAIAGRDSKGQAFEFMWEEECCGPVTTTKCIKELSDPCDVSCPGPANCVCNGTTGSCALLMTVRCSGSCEIACGGQPNEHCKGPVTACDCK